MVWLSLNVAVGRRAATWLSTCGPRSESVSSCSIDKPLARADWFNYRRLLGPIGNIPPAEAEARYYATSEGTALAA